MRRPQTGGRALQALLGVSGVAREGAAAALRQLLEQHKGNVAHAAAELGLSAGQSLWPLIDTLGLRDDVDRIRRGHILYRVAPENILDAVRLITTAKEASIALEHETGLAASMAASVLEKRGVRCRVEKSPADDDS